MSLEPIIAIQLVAPTGAMDGSKSTLFDAVGPGQLTITPSNMTPGKTYTIAVDSSIPPSAIVFTSGARNVPPIHAGAVLRFICLDDQVLYSSSGSIF